MRYVVALFALSLLVACMQTSVSTFRMPDGKTGYIADCPASGGCQDAIEETCPGAYEVLSAGSYDGPTTVSNFGGTYIAQSHDRRVVRFRCRKAPIPASAYVRHASADDGDPDPWHWRDGADAGTP